MSSAAPFLPSDSLARWREFFASHPQLNPGFSELVQVPIVVDASGALADLRWILRRRNPEPVRTALEEAVAAGTVVAYAPPWLREEVNKNLPLMASRERLSLATLREAWERYQSALRFYEPSVTTASNETDPKDVPYRELARELGGIVVYTKDRHLEAMGAHTIGLRELVLLRNFARAASPGLSLKFGGAAAMLVAGASVVALVRTGVRLFVRLPAPVQIGLALAALWTVLHPKSREFLARTVASPKLEPVKRVITKYAEELGNSLTATASSWDAVKGAVPDRRREPLVAHVRAICAAAEVPVSEQAIEWGVRRAGYVSRARNFRDYLRRRLRADSRFVENPRGWWTVTRFRFLTAQSEPFRS